MERIKRRIVSSIIVFVMVLGMVPAELVSVLAKTISENASTKNGTFTYNREVPEVAILNKYNAGMYNIDSTKTKDEFYDLLKGDVAESKDNKKVAAYPQYNAMRSLYGKEWSYTADFKDVSDMSYTVPWSASVDYKDSTIKKLIKKQGNIKLGISTKFINYPHEHHWGFLNSKGAEVNTGLSMVLSMGGASSYTLYGQASLTNKTYTYSGWDQYNALSYRSDDNGAITFTRSSVEIEGTSPCTCIGAKASEFLITMRDEKAPQVIGFQYSTDNGASWRSPFSTSNKTRVKAGGELLIKITYDEPIRFADDSITGKENLYLGLMRNGKDVDKNHRAYLYKLDGDTLYYKYTVPSADKLSEDEKVLSLSQKSLFGKSDDGEANKTISLVQLWAGATNSKFTIKESDVPKGYSTNGFTTSACYITDLAGNPVEEIDITAGELYIDTLAPSVAQVRFDAALNNEDVKQAKADYAPETVNEGDNSDNYLGAGDRLDLTVILSEAISTTSYGKWEYAIAKTNIVAPEGYSPPQGVFVDSDNVVHVKSSYFKPGEPGVYVAYPTEFVMYSIPMVEGMKIKEDSSNTKKELRVDAFSFSSDLTGDITDLAGNAVDKTNVKMNLGANSNPFYLDTTPPVVTGGTYMEFDGGFSFPVEIDKGMGTEVVSTYGKFSLSQTGDDRSYRFEWATNASGRINDLDEDDWKIGSTGNEYSFLQIGTTYFFIREYSKETYETLDNCTLTVKAKDYAGNVGILNADSSVIKWYVDKVAPSVAAGETERKINGDRASVSVKLTITDTHDISSWKYAWTDSETAEPTAWTDGDLSTSNVSPVAVTATAEFDVGEKFEKWLWVKAADDSTNKNSAAICVGKYLYDLSDITYSMVYSDAIEKYAKVKLESLGAEDALVFMFPVNTNLNRYAVKVFKNGETAENIFAEGDWDQYEVTEENGTHKFNRYAVSDVTSSIINGRYYGDLEITMFKIKSAGLEFDENIPGKLTGVGENGGTVYPYTTEKFCLRPASTTPWINYSDYESPELVSPDYISISSRDNLYSKIQTADRWADGEAPVQLLSTLAGVAFEIKVEKDKNGWECADIDTANSKLVFKSRTDGHEIENALGAFVSDGNGGFTQTVVAKGDYTTGLYDVYLRLALITGDVYEFNYQYTERSGGIVVDATKPNASLKISELAYDRFSLFWQKTLNIDDTIYPKRNFANDDIIYLPVSGGFFDREVLGKGNPGDIYDIIFESEGESERGELKNGDELKSYTGQYYIEAWSKDDPEKRVKFYSKEQNQASLTVDGSHGFTTLVSQKDNENYVYLKSDELLKPDEVNIVYVRKVYSNGGISDTQTLKIRPVTNHITGEMSFDKDSMQLVFTPTSAPETYKDGARVYAFAYQTGEAYRGEDSPGKVIEMDVSPSGGWVCPLLSEGAIYRVFTVNSYGSVWAGLEDDYVCQRAPWIEPVSYIGDDTGFTDNGDGTYKWSVYVSDDMGSLKAGGVDLHISFNPEYFVEGYDLHLDESDLDAQGIYKWNSTGRSATGIYKITANYMTDSDKDSEYLRLDIEGVVRRQEQDVQTAQTMNITLAATDNFGYTTTYSTGDKSVTYQKPEILNDSLTDDGLMLEFNQAIYPVETWAWHEGDKEHSWLDDPGYSKSWKGAFPIVGNGTYDVEYYDIFGNLCSTSLTTNAFTDANGYDWSIELIFTETEPTKNDIYITGYLASNAKKENTGLIFTINDNKTTIMVPEGKYDGTYRRDGFAQFDPRRDWSEDNKDATSSPRKVRVGKNGLYKVGVYDTDCVGALSSDVVFVQNIHIDNILKGPTEPEIYWYFSQLGTDMSQAEIEKYVEDHGGDIELEGTAQVWYKTNRRVTPLDDTGTIFLYTNGNQEDTHTFKFENEMGFSTEKTVSMPEGITLVEPKIPYVDCTAPTVDVAIASKRFGKYTTGESFLSDEAAADVAKKFANTGATQGYCLTVNASDESGFEISINDGGTVPNGISALGNQIFVDKAQAFEITVTDKSPQKNKTTVTLTEAWFEKIDTTAPTVAFTQKQLDRYTIEITATLSDLDNKENSTTQGSTEDTISLTAPEGAVRTAPYTYTYTASTNGNVEFVFYDAVGNRNDSSASTFKVQGIDTEPPVLDLTWWPPKTEEDWATGEVTVDYTRPTEKEVNTNVTAVIDADKPMYDVSLFIPEAWGEAATEYKMLEAGRPVAANNPHIYGGPDFELIEFVATPSRITVTVKDRMSFDSSGIYFIATAANKKQTRIDLNGNVSIDKDAPGLDEPVTYTNSYYEKEPGVPYSKPYAVTATIVPDEYVISTNYGEIESGKWGTDYKYYSLGEPLVITFRENGSYKVNLTDRAGNTTVVPVEITGIDRKTPVLTVADRQDSGQQTTINVAADEDCTLTYGATSLSLTAGINQTITFTDNGTYILTATDLAGNKTERAVVVGNIDKIMPRISFIPSTVYILQGSEDTALDALLNAGYTVWDDKSTQAEITVGIDKTSVTLDTAGIYTVTYTVTDKAGNALLANRFVQVVGEDTVCVKIDGNLILPGETAVIEPGAHTLSLTNCDEPFSVKAKMGINGEGQMKYSAASSITFAEDGSFTVTGKSYYTLLVTTQSRKTVRILLCVGL